MSLVSSFFGALPVVDNVRFTLSSYDGDDAISLIIKREAAIYGEVRFDVVQGTRSEFISAVLFPNDSHVLYEGTWFLVNDLCRRNNLQWVKRCYLGFCLTALNMLHGVVKRTVVEPTLITVRYVFLKLTGINVSDVAAYESDDKGAVYLCQVGYVKYYVGMDIGGAVITDIGVEVQTVFFNLRVHRSMDGSFKSEEFYMTNSDAYGYWAYVHHATHVLEAADRLPGLVVVPGDSVGVFSHRFPNKVLVAGDMVVSDMSHPAIVKSTIEQTLIDGLARGGRSLYLGFLSPFLTTRDWELIAQYDYVLVHDSVLFIPPSIMNYCGRGCWSKGLPIVRTHIIPDKPPHMDIPWSTNLLCNGPYSISKPTVVSEYLRGMQPTVPWQIRSGCAENFKRCGYGVTTNECIPLTTGFGDITNSYQYFAPVGKVICPEMIMSDSGTIYLKVRQVYLVDHSSRLGVLCAQRNYGSVIPIGYGFFESRERELVLSNAMCSITLKFVDNDDRGVDIIKLEFGFLVSRPGMGSVKVDFWRDVEKLFSPGTDLSAFKPPDSKIIIEERIKKKESGIRSVGLRRSVYNPWEPIDDENTGFFFRISEYYDAKTPYVFFVPKIHLAILEALSNEWGVVHHPEYAIFEFQFSRILQRKPFSKAVRFVPGLERCNSNVSLRELISFMFQDDDNFPLHYAVLNQCFKLGNDVIKPMLRMVGRFVVDDVITGGDD